MYAVIVANAPNFDASPYSDLFNRADLIIAADGGGNALAALGVQPHLVIGDFDSLDAATLATFTAQGATIARYPAEKDETDLELALLRAVELGAVRIDVLGAMGGRWDQMLANVALLALPELRRLRVRMLADDQELFLISEQAMIDAPPGTVISLLPLGGPAHGITTDGLYYPLVGATLSFERSRGVSNVIVSPPAQVTVAQGLLIAVVQR